MSTATLTGPVCARCSHGFGRDRVQVRHGSVAEIRGCSGPVPVPAVSSVIDFLPPPVAEFDEPAAEVLAAVFAPAESSPRLPVPGEIWAIGEVLYKVTPARGSDRIFAHELVSPIVAGARLEWAYRGLARRVLADAVPAPAELVARIGRVVGSCVYCSRLLTDDRSVQVGYGPVCAEQRGLPWG